MALAMNCIYDLLVQVSVIFSLYASVGYLGTVQRPLFDGHYVKVIIINNVLKNVMDTDNQVITFF